MRASKRSVRSAISVGPLSPCAIYNVHARAFRRISLMAYFVSHRLVFGGHLTERGVRRAGISAGAEVPRPFAETMTRTHGGKYESLPKFRSLVVSGIAARSRECGGDARCLCMAIDREYRGIDAFRRV